MHVKRSELTPKLLVATRADVGDGAHGVAAAEHGIARGRDVEVADARVFRAELRNDDRLERDEREHGGDCPGDGFASAHPSLTHRSASLSFLDSLRSLGMTKGCPSG